MISDNAAPDSRRDAHRLNAWGALVAMVVGSARLRGYGEDRLVLGAYIPPADDS